MFANAFSKHQKRERCLIYQDNTKKLYWDIYVTVLLLFIVNVMPYHIAFKIGSPRWCMVYNLIDLFFLIDLIMVFFTTLPETERSQEITDRRKIVLNYLTTWFMIDFCSIMPFDTVMTSYTLGKLTICETEKCDTGDCGSGVNVLLRAPKITKVLRGLRLLRLVKVFKLMK